MRLLAFGDPHIKPVEGAIDYDKLQIPAYIDAIVTIGDVIHQPESADMEAGREFFSHLDEHDVPVIVVPGNHDPHEHYVDLVGDCNNIVNVHEQILTAEEFEDVDDDPFDGHRFVGWGCEQFSFKPEVRLINYPGLDPREGTTHTERRYESDRQAQRLEDALLEYIVGGMDRTELCSTLSVSTNRGMFFDQLDRTVDIYETVAGLLERAGHSTIVCTHIPPYNTELDRHHSIGEREIDQEGLHVGSIGLKLALRKHRPIASLSGHSHNGAYEPGIGESGRPHMLNLDYQGIASITIDGGGEKFSYEFHHRGS